jgi:glycerophosphoryl diester phosphodiesterase
VQGCVRDRTAAELAALRLSGTEEHIPTLAALLALIGGRVPLVIELKEMPGRDAGFVQRVADALRPYDSHAALMSFAGSLVAEMQALVPDRPRGLTAEGDWRTGAGHLKTVLALKADFISYAIADLPTPFPLLAWRLLGMPLICWTVRTPAERAKARRWTDQITFEGFAP